MAGRMPLTCVQALQPFTDIQTISDLLSHNPRLRKGSTSGPGTIGLVAEAPVAPRLRAEAAFRFKDRSQRLAHPDVVHGVEEGTAQAPPPGQVRGPALPHGLGAAVAGETFPGMRMTPSVRHVPFTPEGSGIVAENDPGVFY